MSSMIDANVLTVKTLPSWSRMSGSDYVVEVPRKRKKPAKKKDPRAIEVGLILRAAREATGLTQEQVEERLALTARTLSRNENGESFPSLKTLDALAVLYGQPVESLLGRAPLVAVDATRLAVSGAKSLSSMTLIELAAVTESLSIEFQRRLRAENAE